VSILDVICFTMNNFASKVMIYSGCCKYYFAVFVLYGLFGTAKLSETSRTTKRLYLFILFTPGRNAQLLFLMCFVIFCSVQPTILAYCFAVISFAIVCNFFYVACAIFFLFLSANAPIALLYLTGLVISALLIRSLNLSDGVRCLLFHL
jgi:hypothetical protein